MAVTGAIDPAMLAKLPKSYLKEDISQRLIATAITFLVLQTVFVALFYTARKINKTLNGLECWLFIPIGYVFSTALCICGIFMVKYGGAGRHVEAVILDNPQKVITRGKIDKSLEFIDFAAITGSKLAILCLYHRIFTTTPYKIATYVTGTMVILNWLAALILSVTICRPFAFQWDRKIPGGHCGDIITAYQFIGVPNIVTDVMMMVLPMPAIYKLHVDLAAKLGLFATFLMGSIGVVTSILRLNTFIHAAELFKDPTYKCIATYTFTIAEAGTYLIAACMPSLRPLKRHLLPEHSFTAYLDSVIYKVGGSSRSKSQSFGSFGKKGHMRMSDPESDPARGYESAETTHVVMLNDIGKLAGPKEHP